MRTVLKEGREKKRSKDDDDDDDEVVKKASKHESETWLEEVKTEA